jgi:hypothetical protein
VSPALTASRSFLRPPAKFCIAVERDSSASFSHPVQVFAFESSDHLGELPG